MRDVYPMYQNALPEWMIKQLRYDFRLNLKSYIQYIETNGEIAQSALNLWQAN